MKRPMMFLAFFFAFFPGCAILCPDKPTALDRQYVENVAQVRILAQHALANLPQFREPANAIVRQAYIDKLAAMEEYEAVILSDER